MRRPRVVLLLLAFAGCATAPATPARHGTLSELSIVDEEQPTLCAHKVPDKVCALCHPELAPRFQAANDWCGEHAVPESQCLVCHPDLTFEALPRLPEGADLRVLSSQGEDVPALEPHAAPGKVTIFDFYADWCAPCRKVDRHVYGLLKSRGDIAYRKINMVSWDTPIAKRYLAKVPTMPHAIVYGRDGKALGAVSGLDLPALDALIAKAGP